MAAEPTSDAVLATARDGETDRYLAALLAPRAARDGLLALAAFSAELGRIARLVTREPTMGEIRLQWWRDALEAVDAGLRTGNPVADALGAARIRHALPGAPLVAMVDARESDLQAEPFADEDKLDAYLAGSEAAPFALAALVAGAAPGADLDGACAAAGRAYGLARLLLGLPQALARGRLPLPQARLARAGLEAEQLLIGSGDLGPLLTDLAADSRRNLATCRQHVAHLPRRAWVAFLPLALVEPYLRALERPDRDPLREVAGVAPLQRIGGLPPPIGWAVRELPSGPGWRGEGGRKN